MDSFFFPFINEGKWETNLKLVVEIERGVGSGKIEIMNNGRALDHIFL